MRGDSEPLLRAQNPTYGTVELGEIHTGIQKASGLRKIGIACLLLGLVVGYFLNEPLNKGWHEMMRRRWAGEENHRAIIREEWAVEARRHETERAATREAWAVEAQRHETEHAAKREAWAIEARRHDTERAAMQEERRKWDRERREKEEKVKQEKEEEARKRESIAWVGLEPGHCLRYRLKEYTAVLSHVPLGIDGIEECWKKSVEIHGREWFPSQCEDQVRKIRMLLLNRSLTFII